jgi:hypothetical protein
VVQGFGGYHAHHALVAGQVGQGWVIVFVGLAYKGIKFGFGAAYRYNAVALGLLHQCR